ncbi:hypothetical protein BH11GEM2_BH11GEM2_27130 [soil metagenome]|jgi:hypothetical protein
MQRKFLLTVATAGIAAIAACSSDGSLTPVGADATQGTLVVKLTDDPFTFDSVSRVDLYIARVDGRRAAVDSAQKADSTHPGENKDPDNGWVVLAEPKARFNLVELQQGTTVDLGQLKLPVGEYKGFRIIIIADSSTMTLKSGVVLTKTSKPGLNWPKSGQVVINIPVTNAVKVQPGTNSFVVDFDLAKSFEIPQGRISTLGASWRGWASGIIDNDKLPATGSVTGKVRRDSVTGAVGALVQVELMKGGSTLADTAKADVLATQRATLDGVWRFAYVPAGTYVVRATPGKDSGYRPAVLGSLVVVGGKEAGGNVVVLPKLVP